MTDSFQNDPDQPLTPMQKRFVAELVSDPAHNASQAALRAGFSPANARFQAYQLKKKPHIAKAIEKGMEEIAKDVGITKERILSELAKIAFADLSYHVNTDEDGNPVISLHNGSTTAPISEVEIIKGLKSVTKIKASTAGKREALMDIAKILGWSKDKVEVTGQFSLERLVNESFDEPEPLELPAE